MLENKIIGIGLEWNKQLPFFMSTLKKLKGVSRQSIEVLEVLREFSKFAKQNQLKIFNQQ